MLYHPKLELWLALFMPFSTLYALFHIFICFSYSVGPFIKLDVFLFSIIFIFLMNDAFFSFIQQFIHFFVAKYSFNKIFIFFREALFKFKISFIQNNAVFFIQKNYYFFEKSRIGQGYSETETTLRCKYISDANVYWKCILCYFLFYIHATSDRQSVSSLQCLFSPFVYLVCKGGKWLFRTTLDCG